MMWLQLYLLVAVNYAFYFLGWMDGSGHKGWPIPVTALVVGAGWPVVFCCRIYCKYFQARG